jgi:OFA family oxalate/formate antiporter-like MFS transporter
MPENELSRGWRLIFASCMGVICSSIVLPYYTIGALVVPITEEFGWTRAEFQMAILFSSGLGALTSPVIGWLIDRYGARRLAIPGLVGLSVGFVIAACMNGELWMLYLAYATMAVLGAGTIPVTWTRAIATNFFNRRGLALGLTLTGTGICAVAAPHYTVWLTENYGWRVAYAGIALLPIFLAGPIVFLLFKPVEGVAGKDEGNEWQSEIDSGLSFGEAIRSYRFWVLALSILLAYMGFSGIGTNLFPSLTDDGFSSSDAATVQSIYGGSIVIGRVVVGYLVDRFWAPGVAAFALALPTVGALIFFGAPSFYVAAAASFLIGFAAGAELDLMSFLAAKYFGLRHYAKIYAVLYSTLAVCSGTAPMLFAMVYDRTNSYDFSFLVASILFALSTVMVLFLGRYPDDFPADQQEL